MIRATLVLSNAVLHLTQMIGFFRRECSPDSSPLSINKKGCEFDERKQTSILKGIDMVTQSQNSGLGGETAQPENGGEELVRQSSDTSVFVNSEPMREEQIQNAVKFLSHPKVRGSPVIHRRSFLEKKGLTKVEIDEAFRRVPDAPPSVQTAGVNQGEVSNVGIAGWSYLTGFPLSAALSHDSPVILSDGQLKASSNIQQQGQSQALQPTVPASTGVTSSVRTFSRRISFTDACFAVGIIAASAFGTVILIKKSVLPWLKSWIRNVALEEENDQLKRIGTKPSVAEEAAQAAKAAAEMKLMTSAIRRLEGLAYDLAMALVYLLRMALIIQQLIVNGKSDYESQTVRSSSPPVSVEPSSAPHPKSYMEVNLFYYAAAWFVGTDYSIFNLRYPLYILINIMAMIQRGEKPSNIREIDDSPPNPYQQPSNPRLAPRAKPWEVSQVQNTSTRVLPYQANGKVQDNGDNQVPWWQTKNVSIKEIDSETEYSGEPTGSSRQPVQRAWVPPQPPPIAIPEAAEAIRRPKSVAQKEVTSDDQSAAHPSDLSDGSKSEDAIEGSNNNSLVSSGETQNHEGQVAIICMGTDQFILPIASGNGDMLQGLQDLKHA
ncbi:hypothetical protein Fmac_008837 [Flemingia macrophylla]|uniref:Peroxisomal membrane protein PEX14 n=1 Tax=Flemingia macrophylla TaxID=520843 RepID=A0ABD1MYJ8_9FABA